MARDKTLDQHVRYEFWMLEYAQTRLRLFGQTPVAPVYAERERNLLIEAWILHASNLYEHLGPRKRALARYHDTVQAAALDHLLGIHAARNQAKVDIDPIMGGVVSELRTAYWNILYPDDKRSGVA